MTRIGDVFVTTCEECGELVSYEVKGELVGDEFRIYAQLLAACEHMPESAGDE